VHLVAVEGHLVGNAVQEGAAGRHAARPAKTPGGPPGVPFPFREPVRRRGSMQRFPRTLAACLGVLTVMAAARAPGRKEVVIGAADLAPAAQRSDRPVPGKWWLKRDAKDWGARDGAILLTGRPGEGPVKSGEWVVPPAHLFVPSRVPALVIDPKAS